MSEGKPVVLGELLFLSGARKGQTFQITRERLNIGRQPDASNDLILLEASISRHHAALSWENGVWHISKVSANNTLFVEKQEVKESSILHNRNVIQLGNDIELLFLSFVAEKAPDPGFDSTIYSALPFQTHASESKEKPTPPPVSDDPLKNPGHPVWQIIGLFTTLSGVLVAAIPSDTIAKAGQIIIALLTVLLCTFLLQRTRKKLVAAPSSPPVPGEVLSKQPEGRRSLRLALGINLTLVMAGVLTVLFTMIVSLLSLFSSIGAALSNQSASQSSTLTIFVIVLLLLGGGLLISFLSLVFQIFHLMRKKLLEGKRALGLVASALGITLGITLATFVGFALIANLVPQGQNNPFLGLVEILLFIIGLNTLVLALESLLMFLIIGIRLLFSPDRPAAQAAR
jgi:pSer/pThr/pTyr-binding forkhead associated (FHA) protein